MGSALIDGIASLEQRGIENGTSIEKKCQSLVRVHLYSFPKVAVKPALA